MKKFFFKVLLVGSFFSFLFYVYYRPKIYTNISQNSNIINVLTLKNNIKNEVKIEKSFTITKSTTSTFSSIGNETNRNTSNETEKNNLLCIILTSKKTLFTRSNVLWDTWAKNCTKAVFASNITTASVASSNLTTENRAFLNKITLLTLPINESYDLMAEKVLKTVQIAYELYGDKFNWFLLVDDDTFIYTKNVYTFLKTHDSKQPETYGYNFKRVVQSGYHSGGGGTLITHESMKRFHQKITDKKCEFKDGYGDVALGLCSRIASVKIGNSLDLLGRERFHPLDPVSHYQAFFPDWLFEYATNKLQSGIECCSLETISFHYVSTEDMYKLSQYDNYLDFIKS